MLYPNVDEKYIDGEPNPYYREVLRNNLFYKGYCAGVADMFDVLNEEHLEFGCTPTLLKIFKELSDVYKEEVKESIELFEEEMVICLIDEMPECVHKMRMKEIYGEEYNG